MIYKNQKTKRHNFPFKLPFKLNSIFFKSLLLTILVVTFIITMSFLSKRKHETLPAQAKFLEFDIAQKNRQDINDLINKEINPVLQNMSVTLKLDERNLKIVGSEYDFKFDGEDFFNDAKKINFEKKELFLPKIRYNKEKLKQTLENFKKSSKIEPSTFSYKRDGTILHVSAGSDGRILNVKDSLSLIVNAFQQFKKNEIIDAVCETIPANNKKIDFKKLQKAVNCEAKNAHYSRNSAGKIIAEKEQVGVILDDQEIKKIDNPNKGSYKLKVRLINPTITFASLKASALKDENLKDVLASFKTTMARNKSANGIFNIKKATRAINNTVIMPGEEFSFQNCVVEEEKRSKEPYKEAIVYNPHAPGGEELGVGGGICQVCSTLFGAVLRCDLPVTQRQCHSFTVAYVPIGQDAAYSRGSKNLRFINNRINPIIVKAGINGRDIVISICGKKLPEEDVIVEISSKQTTSTTKQICATAVQTVYTKVKGPDGRIERKQKKAPWVFHSQYGVRQKDSKKRAILPETTQPSASPPEEIQKAVPDNSNNKPQNVVTQTQTPAATDSNANVKQNTTTKSTNQSNTNTNSTSPDTTQKNSTTNSSNNSTTQNKTLNNANNSTSTVSSPSQNSTTNSNTTVNSNSSSQTHNSNPTTSSNKTQVNSNTATATNNQQKNSPAQTNLTNKTAANNNTTTSITTNNTATNAN